MLWRSGSVRAKSTISPTHRRNRVGCEDMKQNAPIQSPSARPWCQSCRELFATFALESSNHLTILNDIEMARLQGDFRGERSLQISVVTAAERREVAREKFSSHRSNRCNAAA
jgi:hypothetical protein